MLNRLQTTLDSNTPHHVADIYMWNVKINGWKASLQKWHVKARSKERDHEFDICEKLGKPLNVTPLNQNVRVVGSVHSDNRDVIGIVAAIRLDIDAHRFFPKPWQQTNHLLRPKARGKPRPVLDLIRLQRLIRRPFNGICLCRTHRQLGINHRFPVTKSGIPKLLLRLLTNTRCDDKCPRQPRLIAVKWNWH